MKLRFSQFLKRLLLFINNDRTPRVLGRAGIFEYFTVIFEEAKHRSGFAGKRTRTAQAIQKILDKGA